MLYRQTGQGPVIDGKSHYIFYICMTIYSKNPEVSTRQDLINKLGLKNNLAWCKFKIQKHMKKLVCYIFTWFVFWFFFGRSPIKIPDINMLIFWLWKIPTLVSKLEGQHLSPKFWQIIANYRKHCEEPPCSQGSAWISNPCFPDIPLI